jgi:hypothetical protein
MRGEKGGKSDPWVRFLVKKCALVQRREKLVVNGYASPYHNLLETGWVSYYLNGLERVQDLNVTS